MGRLGLLLGASPPMQALYEMLNRVAPTDASVFLIGESGTGKDLAAQTLHLLSRRAKAPFLPLNCGAISPTLIESELFGHERGSFTGAQRRHKGYFERAHSGTLFLDEITEMPIELQVKLLRVLETGAVVRIGGDQAVDVDVRVIAATNRDPLKAVQDGKMREDLLYRLQVFPIHDAAAARARRGHPAARRLLPRPAQRAAGDRQGLDARTRSTGCAPIPGPATCASSRTWCTGPSSWPTTRSPRAACRARWGDSGSIRSLNFQVGTSIEEVERRLIMATLDAYAGNKRKTADILGVSLKTLYNRLNTYREE